MKSKYKKVEVVWVDSEHNSDWTLLSEILEDKGSLDCQSCGYLVLDTPDRITLATSVTSDSEVEEQASAYITIPRAAIKSIIELRPVAVKKKKLPVEQS